MSSKTAIFWFSCLAIPSVLSAQSNALNSTGNVGIGTTTPVTSLQVVGPFTPSYMQLVVRSTGTDDRAGISFWSNAGARAGHVYVVPTGDFILSREQIGMFRFFSNGVERLTIAANGNVGIGTNGPAAKLEITNGQNGVVALNIVGGGSNAHTASITTNYPSISATGTNYVRSVGFYSHFLPIAAGVTDSGYRIGLDVENFITDPNFLGSLNMQIGVWARVGSYVGGGGTVVNSYGVYIDNIDGPATITNRYGLFQESARAKNYFAGNVGIGTTNPTQKLSVNGTIKAKEVIVETTGWSDYVFADNYALPSLSSVEEIIKRDRHLPGMPNASEVAEQGIGLGEMQAKLLAKIEELTLHQIAQEKRIRALEVENARLSTR